MSPYGQSGIGTSSGLFGFSKNGSAFLPRGSNSWIELQTPSNSSFQLSCVVPISTSELLVMGGGVNNADGRKVWKLTISDNFTSHEWTNMKELKTERWGHGCSLHSTEHHEKYVILAGKNICNQEYKWRKTKKNFKSKYLLSIQFTTTITVRKIEEHLPWNFRWRPKG